MNMRLRGAAFVLVMATLMLSGCDSVKTYLRGLLGGEKTVQWEDPNGDAIDRNYPQRDGTTLQIPSLDIVNVTAEGKEGELHATFEISGTFDDFFSHVDKAGKIHNMMMVELFIDADNSTSTGGTPKASVNASRPLEGYDIVISATPSLLFVGKDGSRGAIAGHTFIDTNRQEMTGYAATYFIKQVPPADKALELNTRAWHENKRKYSSITASTLSIRVPYSWFGVEAGDTIRLCFREMGQNAASGISFSEDKHLKLQ